MGVTWLPLRSGWTGLGPDLSEPDLPYSDPPYDSCPRHGAGTPVVTTGSTP